ncbi:MAG: hypothetical protein NVV57_05065 [Demequina sp.]|jgi:hypothetical protein|nr:hypothetical protein [Demequina sp.]
MRGAVWKVAATLAALMVPAGCDGEVVVPITGAAVSQDGRTLTLEYNACNAEASATVKESPTKVHVYLLAYRPGEATGGECEKSTQVVLEDPLGDRELADTYSDQPIPVTTEG